MKHTTGHPPEVTRRDFVRTSLLCAVSCGAASAIGFLRDSGWTEAGEPPTGTDLVADTFNGLLAFVVPGDDAYSVVQTVSDDKPGGVAAEVVETLKESLDGIQPIPSASTVVANTLNLASLMVASELGIDVSGPFLSPFANLPFAAKVVVFDTLRGFPETKALASSLPVYAAFLAYSEAGSFDPSTGTLDAIPVGWTISNYAGVVRGQDDFEGYFGHRRKTKAR